MNTRYRIDDDGTLFAISAAPERSALTPPPDWQPTVLAAAEYRIGVLAANVRGAEKVLDACRARFAACKAAAAQHKAAAAQHLGDGA